MWHNDEAGKRRFVVRTDTQYYEHNDNACMAVMHSKLDRNLTSIGLAASSETPAANETITTATNWIESMKGTYIKDEIKKGDPHQEEKQQEIDFIHGRFCEMQVKGRVCAPDDKTYRVVVLRGEKVAFVLLCKEDGTPVYDSAHRPMPVVLNACYLRKMHHQLEDLHCIGFRVSPATEMGRPWTRRHFQETLRDAMRATDAAGCTCAFNIRAATTKVSQPMCMVSPVRDMAVGVREWLPSASPAS